MKQAIADFHPDLQNIARIKPRIRLNKFKAALINRIQPWLIRPKTSADVLIDNVFIQGKEENSKIRLRIYQPETTIKRMPALIWLHGGGYVIGTPKMDDPTCIEFVRELGIMVISVDYRLAPRHPFPAALEDSWAALKWAATQAGEFGIDPTRIAIGGSSAGGGLAAALAQLAHDRGEVSPVFQLLVYPMLDDRTVERPDLRDKQFLIWPQESNRFGWESYLAKPCGEDHMPDYAVPARRGDLSGLPPTWIGVGNMDLFHDEVVSYAQKLTACDVECELVVVPGAFHGFDAVRSRIPIVREFRESQINVLHENLNSFKNNPIK
jgi:acetyl esterase/lipase